MAAEKRPYRQLAEISWEGTHFTREECRRAVLDVLKEDGDERSGCATVLNTGDPQGKREGGRMRRTRKPFRTLKAPLFPPDHFTMEEAAAAVEAVMAEHGIVPVYDVVEQPRRAGSVGQAENHAHAA